MSYYKNKKKVFNQLKDILDKAKDDKIEIDLNELKIQIFLNFEIGDLSINKMIDLLQKHYNFKIEGDVLKWGAKK